VRVAAEERAPPPPLTHPLYVCVHCRRGWLQHEINLRAQELTEKKKQDKIKSALSKRKREEREAVASGKNPFYLKVGRGSLCMLSMAAIAAYAHCYACCWYNSARTRRRWSCRPNFRTCRSRVGCPSSWPRSARRTRARTTAGCPHSERSDRRAGTHAVGSVDVPALFSVLRLLRHATANRLHVLNDTADCRLSPVDCAMPNVNS